VNDQCYDPVTSHGGTATRVRYRNSAVDAPNSCRSEMQTITCHDGLWDYWSGSYQHATCQVRAQCHSPTTSHGGTTTRTQYESPIVNLPDTCTSQEQTRTCSDGQWTEWSGSYDYPSCFEQDAPTAKPTPSPTGVRLCKVPEHYTTDCDSILHDSRCKITFVCDPGEFAVGVYQTCKEMDGTHVWQGDEELNPNCQRRTCVLPSQQPDGVIFGESPELTQCDSVDCDNYNLKDVTCPEFHKMSLTKCTVERDFVTIECISCIEDDKGNCVTRSTIPTLGIFENFYHGINIEDPFGHTYGYNIFGLSEGIPTATLDQWQADMIKTSPKKNPYIFVLEDQFSRKHTGSKGSAKSSTRSFKHYGEYVEHNSEKVETSVELSTPLMEKAKENSANGSKTTSKPKKYGSIGVAGSKMDNRIHGEKYSHFVQFKASQFDRKQVFDTFRFDPNHNNVKLSSDFVSALKSLQPYSTSTEYQYRNLFDLYGTHYASTFDFGYEINAAEFSSECEYGEEKTLSLTRENCFEATFLYKFTELKGSGCTTTTHDSGSKKEDYMSFETATFEVRGGNTHLNHALVEKLAEMKFDGSTKHTDAYKNWVESTYANPGIVGFTAHPVWRLIWNHPTLDEPEHKSHFTQVRRQQLITGMEEAFYAILQQKEDAYRQEWCHAECNCGIDVDPVSCSCNGCFRNFASEDCCLQSSTMDLNTCRKNKAGMAQLGLAIFALVSLMF